METVTTRIENKINTFGKLAWLWANSDLHRSWAVDQMTQFVMPAIEKNQYCIIEENGTPMAYCSWALLNEEAERDYILDPGRMKYESWDCGDRLWFCDFVSPFATRYTWKLRTELARRFPKHVSRAIRVKKGERKASP